MARFRVTARKSVTPVIDRVMIPSDSHRPRTRVQTAIRLKELALENQDRTIRKLRTSNYDRRRQVEDLSTKLMAAEKRNDEIFHLFELTKADNFELRDIVEVATGQAKRSKEEINLRIQELAEAQQARV